MYEVEELKKLFLRIHGYPLNLDNPQSYNEKIAYRKLFDRNPLLIVTSDKYRARQYIRDKIGWEADNHLVPLLYVTDNPETIPFDRLPGEYIIKPNNGSGRYIIVEGVKGIKKYDVNYTHRKALNLSNKEVVDICKGWFKTIHGTAFFEWAYQNIEPLVVVEKLLREESNKIPNDFRIAMFDGKCKLIYVTDYGLHNYSYYDENWNALPIKRPGHSSPPIEKPKAFDKMIEFAERLSEGWDFVRIDFFLVDGYIYFSEMTHYPGSGYAKFPKDLDFKLGKYWKRKEEGM